MNIMIIILTILATLTIGSYTAAVCIKGKRVPDSISASFYILEHKWWFRFTMWMTPILLMPAILEVSKENTHFLAFLALVGMFAVGSAPDYENDPFQRKVHIIGAIMSLLFSQLWVLFNCWWILIPIWLAYGIYTITRMRRYENRPPSDLREMFMETKPMFWLEICSITTAILATLF